MYHSKKKILFVSHDASRTGAPIVLLNLLEKLKNENRFELSIFLKHSGALEDDFQAIGQTYTYAPAKGNVIRRIAKRLTSNASQPQSYQLPSYLLKQNFDLIYLNTVVCLDLAPYLKRTFHCPIICHVHEDKFTIQYYYRQYIKAVNLKCIDHFIAVSKSVKDNLVENYEMSDQTVSLIPEFISAEKTKRQSLSTAAIKKELILTDAFIVGGSGLTSWRKGVDLFVQLAGVLNELRPGNKIKLVWVGNISHEFDCQFNYEAIKLGVADQIIFTGAKTNPLDYFKLFDVFALTSREDPFPLVALEAAALNKPIVCFDNSGGIPEVIENGKNGVVVPYGDVKEMAISILQLMDDSIKRLKMGEEIGQLVNNFDVNIAGRQITQLIDQLIVN